MKNAFRTFVLASLFFAAAGLSAQDGAVIQNNSVIIKTNQMSMTLEAPHLVIGGNQVDPVSVKTENNVLTATYKGGQKTVVQFNADKTGINVKTTGLKKDDKVRVRTMPPLHYAGGAHWTVKEKNGLFPKVLDEKNWIMYGGHSPFLEIKTETDDAIRLTCKAYYQLQDNRRWGWNAFSVYITPELKGGTWSMTWELKPAQARKILVDRYGQLTSVDFPEKVKSDEDLKGDVARDKAYYGSMKPLKPGDKWGGLAGSKEKYNLKATGFFRVEKVKGRYMLVTPEGNLFFHLGVCVMGNCEDYTYIRERESIYEWLPKMEGIWEPAFLNKHSEFFSHYIANIIRKTGKPCDEDWQCEQIYRIRQLGFNSIGAFSGACKKAHDTLFIPVTPFLTVNEGARCGEYHRPLPGMIPDPFDEHNIKLMDEVFKQDLLPNVNDPSILGYFTGCERHYNDVAVNVLRADRCAAKERFCKMMQEKYKTVDAFNKAWNKTLPDFNAFCDTKLTVETEAASKDTEAFQELFLETYYKLINDTFRRYDKNHLWIGDRYLPAQSGNQAALKAAGKYMDIFSCNYYVRDFDSDMLTRVAETCGRPLILSEWSYGSPVQGQLGCINCKDDAERGKMYQIYQENAAANPWIVGTQWFTLIDQSVTGKWFGYLNSEAMNTGLINVADRPYKEMHKYVQETNRRLYDIALNGVKPVPVNAVSKKLMEVQISHIKPDNKIDADFHGWQTRTGERIRKIAESVAPVTTENADFWGAWDEKYLYLFVQVTDPTPAENPGDKDSLWMADGIEVFFGPDVKGKGAMGFKDRQLCIGACGSKTAYKWYNSGKNSKVISAIAKNADGYALEVAIPWSEIGFKPVPEKRLHFDIAVDFGESGKSEKQKRRTLQLMWSGKADNYYNRDQWGQLILVP